jgi:hypothetical protein
MRQTSGERCRSQSNVVLPRACIEIAVAITASAIMALMVVGGGVAAERWIGVDDAAITGAGHEPPPLSWREKT